MYVCVCVEVTGNVYVLLHSLLHTYTHNAATGYYCSQTPIKTCLARGISVINEIKSGLLVVARLLVVLPGWHWRLFSLTSSSLNSPTTQLFICSAADVLSLTLVPQQSTAIMPLTPKGLLSQRGVPPRLCVFLMGRRMSSYTSLSRGAHPESSLHLGGRGLEIAKIIKYCTTYGNFAALQAVSWLGSKVPLVWLPQCSCCKCLRIIFHYHCWY